MAKSNLVSVVVPVKNSEKTISKTLGSILNQSYKRIEIIVIDDGSTDNTEKTIKEVVKENKYKIKIRYLKNGKNLGPAITRNKGIKNAKGKVIFFTDSDCFVPEKWLEKIMKEYTERDIGGVGGYLEPGEKNFVAWLERMQNKYLLKIGNEKVTGYGECPTGYTNSMTYLKEALIKVNGFDENFKFPSGEDFDLKKRICKAGYKLVYLPLPITHLENYDFDYLLKRIITRGLNRKLPGSKTKRFFYVLIMSPKITLNILKKIFRYKKENLI